MRGSHLSTSLRVSNIKVILCIILNFVVSLSLIWANKLIFNFQKDTNHDLIESKLAVVQPIILVWYHSFSTTVCHFFYVKFCNRRNARVRNISGSMNSDLILDEKSDQIGSGKNGSNLLIKIFPLAFAFCGFAIFPNYSLKNNTLGTYQVLKVMSDPVMILLEQFLYQKEYSLQLKCSLIPIVLGGVCNSIFDLSFNLLGLVFGILGVLSTAFYIILINHRQKSLKLTSQELLYYQAPLSCLILSVIIIFMSFGEELEATVRLSRSASPSAHDFITFTETSEEIKTSILNSLTKPFQIFIYAKYRSNYQNLIIFSTGPLAYLINLTNFWTVGNTSVFFAAIASKMKFIGIILIGVVYFRDPLSVMQFVSVSLTVVGVLYYGYVTYVEKQKRKTEVFGQDFIKREEKI